MGDRKQRRLEVLPDDTGAMRRREWLKLLGAGMALAGAEGCLRERQEKILPYTRQPPNVTPGIPRYYATSLPLDGFATGVLVLSHDGRPTKIEGNPDHPASLGATSIFDQAAIIDLYDPDRASSIRTPEGPSGMDPIIAHFAGPRADAGERLRFLLGSEGSPLMGHLLGRIRERFPKARFTFHDGSRPAFAGQGGRLAFGAPVQPQYDFGAAKVVLSLADDFLATGPFSVRYARQFASRRRVAKPTDSMNRLYAVETTFTATGTLADHRLRRKPSEIAWVAGRAAAEIANLPGVKRPPRAVLDALAHFRGGTADPVVLALARDLARNAGASIVTVGPGQPPIVHALGHLMNSMVGSERTAWNIAPTLVSLGDAEQDLGSLIAEIDAGAVETLVIVGNNPVYSAPVDLDLGRRIRSVATVLYLGSHEDETAAVADWFVPAAHPLESWGDATAYDGTTSLLQPLIKPMRGGRSAVEILSLFAGVDHPDDRRALESFWTARHPDDFQDFWPKALTTGVIAGTAAPRLDRPLATDAIARALAAHAPEPAVNEIEASFANDPNVHDGRFTNNAWLLEHPQPVTKLAWDNAAQIAPATAARLGLQTEDLVELELGGRRVRAPVIVVPGHADEAVTLHLGWGRGGALTLGREVGFDANRLRTSAAPSFASGLVIHKLPGAKHTLARSQLEMRTEGRPIAPFATLETFKKHTEFTAELRGPLPSMLPAYDMSGDQWAMTIDTSICTSCGACEVACRSENNVLVVGKEEVARGRIMSWLRIDQYFEGPIEAPSVTNEPMLCQHCEKAPCEYVCPVNATVHSGDGLNEMVYNRCVGTRFCSNNCPYKVRRFNWFDYNSEQPANRGRVQLQHNPDVTVRQRGVMEKCTYCVQRIREVEIHARVQNRAIRPGEVVTACQQACPTGAIQFGSLSHRGTKMVEWRNEPRSFEVLHDLGTRPRTVYLARIYNPNPEIG
ncbi:Molybdopterin oxidoreductase, iron-sulfur binding subunit protein [Minicystis rosea]|nr:Molybdopterin oxidoreductase, iron-sulfur binding subunit protein [Minicystis rosea]